MSGEEHRAFSFVDEFDGGIDLRIGCCGWNAVSRKIDLTISFVVVGPPFLHDIFGEVDQHRTRTASASDMKRFVDRGSDVFDSRDEVVVFGDWKRRAGDVCFLERVGSDRRSPDLTCYRDDGNGVHHRGGESRDEVCSTGSRRSNRNSRA